MEREPTKYSRPLVVGGLGAVLLGDLAADLPDALFVGGGAAVLLGAAAVHLVGDEGRAAAGWGFFALALGFFGLLDAESTLSARRRLLAAPGRPRATGEPAHRGPTLTPPAFESRQL
jgi:hypothetical protein